MAELGWPRVITKPHRSTPTVLDARLACREEPDQAGRVCRTALHALRLYRGPREEKFRLVDVIEMFVQVKNNA
jgi:hypothetical protein